MASESFVGIFKSLKLRVKEPCIKNDFNTMLGLIELVSEEEEC